MVLYVLISHYVKSIVAFSAAYATGISRLLSIIEDLSIIMLKIF